MSAKRRRYQAPLKRDRAEVVKAVGISAGIVIATVLMIWLLRPGPSTRFDDGGGGLFNRQPRAAWLVGLTLASAGIYVWWVLSRRHQRSTAVMLGVGGVALGALAIATAILWPGGLLRHYQSAPSFDPADFDDLTTTTLPLEVSSTVPSPVASSTVASSTVASSTVAGDTSTTVPGGTENTVPDSTTDTTEAPTTGSP